MIERISVRIASWIHDSNPEETEPVEVLSYYIAVYLSYVAIIGSSMMIGYCTGAFIDTAITLIAFQALRKISGGFHLPLTLCVVVSIAVLSTAPHIEASNDVMIVIGACSVILMAIFSPAFKVGEIRKEQIITRKLLSVALPMIALLIGESLLIMAFFLQAVTTIRPLRGGENKT